MALTTLGNYRLVALLGQGGMSDVFLAATESTQPIDFTKLVVLKRLRGDYYQDIELVTMFFDEARIAARLNHPNVVQTHEVSEFEGEFFLTMEYLEGETLSRILGRARDEISLGMHLTILCEVLAGIDYAHKLKDYDGTKLSIVHRDVTPQNVFVTFNGRVKVMDFGIAKAVGRIAETRHGVIKGKVLYMAPEQAAVDGTIDQRVDIFAVGVMLYEACTRKRMWDNVADDQVMARLATGDIPTSVQEIDPRLHDELERICEKALAFDPNRRYSSAAEFQADLEAYIDAHERRPSPRQIGTFVEKLFEGQRKTTEEIIESQMAELVNTRKSLPYGSSSPMLGGAPESRRPSQLDLSETASLVPEDAFTEADEPTKIELASQLSKVAPTEAPAPPRSNHVLLYVALCVTAAVVLVFALRAM